MPAYLIWSKDCLTCLSRLLRSFPAFLAKKNIRAVRRTCVNRNKIAPILLRKVAKLSFSSLAGQNKNVSEQKNPQSEAENNARPVLLRQGEFCISHSNPPAVSTTIITSARSKINEVILKKRPVRLTSPAKVYIV